MRTRGFSVLRIPLATRTSAISRANQSDDKAAVRKEVNTAYKSEGWQKAARLYQQLVDGKTWPAEYDLICNRKE
jgi:hypothetical protein